MLSSATMNRPSEASTSVHARRGLAFRSARSTTVSATTPPPRRRSSPAAGPAAADSRASTGSAQPVSAVSDEDTRWKPEWAAASAAQFPPLVVSLLAGAAQKAEGEAVEGWFGGHGPARPGPGRRRAGVRRARRPPPARAAGALLPDPRLGPGRGGRAPGDAAGGLARPGRVRGTFPGADLAVSDRHPALPERAALG